MSLEAKDQTLVVNAKGKFFKSLMKTLARTCCESSEAKSCHKVFIENSSARATGIKMRARCPIFIGLRSVESLSSWDGWIAGSAIVDFNSRADLVEVLA